MVKLDLNNNLNPKVNLHLPDNKNGNVSLLKKPKPNYKMKNKYLFALPAFVGFSFFAHSQQSYNVSEGNPARVEGLEMGIHINNEKDKEVKDKGTFSRYSIRFYVTNTAQEAKIILYKQGLNVMGNVNDMLAQFNIINATGARLTNKSATLRANPCTVLANVDDKDCSNNKIIQNKRMVQIGYWIRPGETIATNAVVIVPLNEQPNVQVLYMVNSMQSGASGSFGANNYQPNNFPQNNNTQSGTVSSSNYKIKNIRSNGFLNNQDGPLVCSPIQIGWLGAQWEISPVNGTKFYLIKNKWTNSYLSVDVSNEIILTNDKVLSSMWLQEPANNNQVYLKNRANDSYLTYENGVLKANSTSGNNSTWLLEVY